MGVQAAAAGIGLERRLSGEPLLAETISQAGAVGSIDEGSEKAAIFGLIDLCRTGQTSGGKLGGHDARLRGASRVQALRVRPIGREGEQSARLRSRESERPCRSFRVETEQHRCRGCGAEGPADGRKVPALEAAGRRIQRQGSADHDLVAGGDRRLDEGAVAILGLTDGEGCGNDHRAGVKLGVVIIVELVSVRRGTVHERCVGRPQDADLVAPDARSTARGRTRVRPRAPRSESPRSRAGSCRKGRHRPCPARAVAAPGVSQGARPRAAAPRSIPRRPSSVCQIGCPMASSDTTNERARAVPLALAVAIADKFFFIAAP